MKLKVRGLERILFNVQLSTGITDESISDACYYERGEIALMIALLDKLGWEHDSRLLLWTRRGYTERGRKVKQ